HCQKCGKDIYAVQNWKNPSKKAGKYKQQYVYVCPSDGTVVDPYYYAAFNAIDWSDLGRKIGEREKPLSENTIRRIEYGLNKYGSEPLQVLNYSPGYCKPLSEPTSTVTTTDHHSILTPFVIKGEHTLQNGYVKSV